MAKIDLVALKFQRTIVLDIYKIQREKQKMLIRLNIVKKFQIGKKSMNQNSIS